MDDAIGKEIYNANVQGKYLDGSALDILKEYFATGELRVNIAQEIASNGTLIVKEAVARTLLYTDLTRPGGNMYTTRRYAACIRDLDYYLRYATYAMLAGDPSILDERVLNGLKETYNSLGVPIPPTVNAIQAMKEVITNSIGEYAGREMGVYLDYICSALSDPYILPASNHSLPSLVKRLKSLFSRWKVGGSVSDYPVPRLQSTPTVVSSSTFEEKKVVDIDLNAPLESFRGREDELYNQIFKEDSSKNTIIRVVRLLISLDNDKANILLEKLFFFNDAVETNCSLSSEVTEAIEKSLFGIFPHLAKRYIEAGGEQMVQYVERILNAGTSKAKEACLFSLFSLQNLNIPDLSKPLLKFSYTTFESDPTISKLAMKVAEKYVEETEIRQCDSGEWEVEFTLKSVA